MLLQERREDEQAPEAVDDRRNAGEKLDRRSDRPAQRMRAKLGEEDCNAEADRYRDDHGDDGCNHRAVDRRQRAILAGGGVPDVGEEEAEAERFKRGNRAVDQRRDDTAEEQQNDDRRREGHPAKRGVTKLETR